MRVQSQIEARIGAIELLRYHGDIEYLTITHSCGWLAPEGKFAHLLQHLCRPYPSDPGVAAVFPMQFRDLAARVLADDALYSQNVSTSLHRSIEGRK